MTPAQVVATLPREPPLTLRRATERWFKEHRKDAKRGGGEIAPTTRRYYENGLK